MILIIAVVLLLAGITLFLVELFDAVEDFDDRER